MISKIRKKGPTFRLISEGESFFLVGIDTIKVSLFKYEYPFLEKPVTFEGIQDAGVLDIASMKVVAISQRGTERDIVDLYFILRDIPFCKTPV